MWRKGCDTSSQTEEECPANNVCCESLLLIKFCFISYPTYSTYSSCISHVASWIRDDAKSTRLWFSGPTSSFHLKVIWKSKVSTAVYKKDLIILSFCLTTNFMKIVISFFLLPTLLNKPVIHTGLLVYRHTWWSSEVAWSEEQWFLSLNTEIIDIYKPVRVTWCNFLN